MNEEHTTLQLVVLSFAVQRLIALQCIAHPELRDAWRKLPEDVRRIMSSEGVAAVDDAESIARDLIGGLVLPIRAPE